MIEWLKKYWWVLGLFAVSCSAWLLSFINQPPRYQLIPLQFTNWHILSIGINGFLVALLFFFKQKKLTLIPLFFLIQPLSYIANTFICKNILGVDYTDINWKFYSDLIFFTVELLFFVPLVFFLGKEDRDPTRIFIRPVRTAPATPIHIYKNKDMTYIFVLHFIAQNFVCIGIYVWHLLMHGISLDIILYYLPLQMVFAVLLGFKEEFIFRWILLKGLQNIFQSPFVAAVLQALAWGFWHFYFGEFGADVASGAWPLLFTFIGGLWFAYCVYALDNIWFAFISHFFIEVYGFYLLYGDLIVKRFGTGG